MKRALGILLTLGFLAAWAAEGLLTIEAHLAAVQPASAENDGMPGAERLPRNPAGVAAAEARIAAALAAAQGAAAGLELPRPVAVHRIKTEEELKVESLIAALARPYFRDVRVGDATLAVRMPFGLDDERGASPGFHQAFLLEGKGTPVELWPAIDEALASKDFARYAAAITSPGRKVVLFDLTRRAWALRRDPQLLGRMEVGRYPGTPTRIYVARDGDPLTGADLYNYLYAVASIGVDCSGFSWRVESELARAFGIDMDQALAKRWRLAPDRVRGVVGLWFFDPASLMTDSIADRIEDLRPGDMILFRGSDGRIKHSAVIESIDFEAGVIHYLQSTDWAVRDERGVHRSEIRFDPARPAVSLRHYSVHWLQQVRPPFEGEVEPRDWRDDGDRYRWYPDAGGSMIVRPRFLAAALLDGEPAYYVNLYPPSGFPPDEGTRRPPRPGDPLSPR